LHPEIPAFLKVNIITNILLIFFIGAEITDLQSHICYAKISSKVWSQTCSQAKDLWYLPKRSSDSCYFQNLPLLFFNYHFEKVWAAFLHQMATAQCMNTSLD